MSTVTSIMREWNEHLEKGTNMNLKEAVSAFTVVPEGHHENEAKAPIRVKKSEMVGSASNAYGVRRKNIDTLMTTTHKLMTALDKSQKKDSESWAHVGTAGEIANKLSDINQMLGGI
jgi:hypothetical protein